MCFQHVQDRWLLDHFKLLLGLRRVIPINQSVQLLLVPLANLKHLHHRTWDSEWLVQETETDYSGTSSLEQLVAWARFGLVAGATEVLNSAAKDTKASNDPLWWKYWAAKEETNVTKSIFYWGTGFGGLIVLRLDELNHRCCTLHCSTPPFCTQQEAATCQRVGQMSVSL